MSDEEQEFEKIVEAANQKLFNLSTQLMDLNHDAIQDLRSVIKSIREIKQEFDDVFDELIMVHIQSAKTLADLYGDIILKENGFEKPDPEEAVIQDDDGEDECSE